MNTEQLKCRKEFDKYLEKANMSCDDFSFEVQVYTSPDSFLNHEPNILFELTFPSISAACRYMSEFYPYYLFYDVILVQSKVNAPAPYCYIL